MKNKKSNKNPNKEISNLKSIIANQQKAIKNLEDINEMYARNEEFSRLEKIEKEELINVQKRLNDLTVQERKEADKIIKAQQMVQEFSEKERIDADTMINAQKKLKEFSVEEIKRRDILLASILNTNKKINKIHEINVLLNIIFNESKKLFNAERALLTTHKQNIITIKSKYGFKKNEIGEINSILEEQRNALKNNINIIKDNDIISYMIVILQNNDEQFGVIYIDKKLKNGKYRRIDLDTLSIFAVQASIAIQNSIFYNKIQAQNNQLKRHIMLKNHIIRYSSEDIKDPLNDIQNDLNKIIKSSKDNKLDKMYKKLKNIFKIIEKLTSFTELQKEVENMYAHSISLKDIISNILDHHKKLINKKNISLKIDIDTNLPKFEGNTSIITIIMDELLTNAIIYNKEGGSVWINANFKLNTLYITIEDSGIGIKKENKNKVFEQFYREKSSYDIHEYGGGIGLYIVKRFIELYGGELTLNSSFGKSTIVKVILPI